ncbi:hypothetical protein BDV29DRAFT_171088 [Aspergillus leporis]|jgi:hypothetical protein|uniref:Uncharacterized protein n=1 Tax=Aspergillus leporis TaxID=41062 RepID=A0A5N5X5B2_9EURO|nr:hypothetical protein BDV29DRAFT_171088 [Aspergillus leporis]
MAKNPIQVQVIAPPALFRDDFGSDHSQKRKGSHTALLLNAKRGAIFERSGEDKRRTDALDILFLLHYCARNGHPRAEEVPNATKEFVGAFNTQYQAECL